MNVQETAILIQAWQYEIMDFETFTRIRFFMPNLAQLHKGIRELQLAEYPACNIGQHTIEVKLERFAVSKPFLDNYGDLIKTNCVGPTSSEQKNVDFRFEDYDVKPVGEKKQKKRKLLGKRNDETFRQKGKSGVYKYQGDVL